MSYIWKVTAIAAHRAYSYGVLYAVAILLALLLVALFIARRYALAVQRDRAASSLYHTAVFVTLSGGGQEDQQQQQSNGGANNKTLMQQIEEESDEEPGSVDYAALLRELDTPANLARQENEQQQQAAAATATPEEQPQPLLLLNNNTVLPFSFRLISAIEQATVTMLTQRLRFHCSVNMTSSGDNSPEAIARHLSEERRSQPVAVFDIRENVARNRALSFLVAAAADDPTPAGEHSLRRIIDSHRSSAVPSPASLLHTNRSPNLIGSARTAAQFLRQREAFYCNLVDCAISTEEATNNMASHFAYGTDVGSVPSTGRIIGDMLLGSDRCAKRNLRGAHVVVAGGVPATVPDTVACDVDLRLVVSSGGDAESSNSPMRALADDWSRGVVLSQARDEGAALRRYDELLILCVSGPQRRGTTTTTSSSQQIEIPSCASLFQLCTRNKPRIVAVTLPHSPKYLLPEYSTPRDSTVSSQARHRFHCANMKAIGAALDLHAGQIAVAGKKASRQVDFRRFFLNGVKDKVIDATASVVNVFRRVWSKNYVPALQRAGIMADDDRANNGRVHQQRNDDGGEGAPLTMEEKDKSA